MLASVGSSLDKSGTKSIVCLDFLIGVFELQRFHLIDGVYKWGWISLGGMMGNPHADEIDPLTL